MKFKLVEDYTYWWPVTVDLPDPDKPGKVVKQSFTIQFKPISGDESAALIKEIQALPPEERLARQHEELLRSSKDWRDVTDENGEQVPFTEAALKACLQHSWFSRGLYKAYAQSLTPDEARRGN
ncbi:MULTISPECIES: hypothetical protein [unclassified Mesorhizobium]|uniref:hypothetical protein n=1 Tax=unclassified Mesorhizobium TaxID=325217 RepID=UPI0003CECCB0|nr:MULTISPECIES: hypothetical protein [unclassified Mesorhizobium]ESY49019.1 hypothetical protein X745_27980 [Mesorhizobium sp. LNJC374B00]ESY52743.1 hypothetical protein X744_28620 [Mesorhizobium sp. LNJC372A00]WJI81465.1 hypothetical protein NLY34_01510 [Mesorhizobium sp. C374B]WJI87984.1 hypothetical protein NLY42_03925 [Mesorhizobium sp. C372A]